MRIKYNLFGAALLATALAACQEPQTAPELPLAPSTDFTITTLVDGLSKPWSVAELPGGGYLITEIGGRLLRVGADGSRVEIAGLPEDMFVGGQGGLLDVVLAPDFARTGALYLSHAYGTEDANGTALVSARLNGNRLTNVTEIFRANPPKAAGSHFGGRIVVLPDETVVLSLGDGFAYREEAQKAGTHLGKIIRVRADGAFAGNPLSGGSSDRGSSYTPETYTIGHRNVQGLAYDAEGGVLWAHEHGPRGGDELNIITAGENYGWPLATTGTDYQGARITPYESFPGTVAPIHDWVPSIAPSGLAIYRGDMFPDWDGDALIGGLASRDLRRVELEDGKAVSEVDMLSDLDGRVRDVRVARDGAVLVLIEDATQGRLLRLTP